MKNFLAIIAALFFLLNVSAQPTSFERHETTDEKTAATFKSVQNIENFSVTDSDGVDWDLYELLDSGKTVIIDLFFST